MTSWRRTFVHVGGGRHHYLIGAYQQCSDAERQPCGTFFARYPSGGGVGDLTPFEGIRQGPGVFANSVAPAGDIGQLRTRLEAVLGRECADAAEIPVAVSGGLDSWLLVALLKSMGRAVRGWYLRTRIDGYCEFEQVARLGEALAVPVECVSASTADFRRALPDFVNANQFPIYNAHPVSKLLLANAVARRGVNWLVTGDGADQVMGHHWGCDLLPLTLTCFQHSGVRLVAPFLSDEVVGLCQRRYPNKEPVRELARQLGLPEIAKRPALFPERELPDCLGVTMRLLLVLLEVGEPCAASRV